jgi:hypothetical protein
LFAASEKDALPSLKEEGRERERKRGRKRKKERERRLTFLS